MRWRLGLLIGFFALIGYSNGQFTAVLINNNSSTQQPSDPAITGKLSQFQGFRTPRPFPSNANFMYSSIWASWSAWSFCAGKVQVRVRACNTVRGYSCPGPNRETKPCDIPPPRQDDESTKKQPSDYDVHDPWEADRREALKQLHTDYDLAPRVKGKQPTDFKRQLSAGRTPIGTSNFQNPQGPPLKPLTRQSVENLDESAHAPSMTPELLYERKNIIDTDIPKKPLAFASKNIKENQGIVDKNIPRDGDVSPTPIPLPISTKENLLDKDSKPRKQQNSSLRENQSVSSSVSIESQNRQNEWNFGPGKQRLTNRQPFTRQNQSRFTPTTSRFIPTFVPKSTQSLIQTTTIPTTTQQPSTTGKGDHVQISASVQQHFNDAENSKVLASIDELKLRDLSTTQSPIQSSIHEEPLETALEDRPNSSNVEEENQKTLSPDNNSNIITPPPNSKPLIARKPTEEEIEKMAKKIEKTRLNGEAGQLKSNLHSGEIVHDKVPNMNDETAKALDWMLRNMTQATQLTQNPTQKSSEHEVSSHSQEQQSNPLKSFNIHRVFASKTLPEGRINRDGNVHSVIVSNPDEEETQLETELTALKESMKQMETELKELRDVENESQQPKFDVKNALNLNLVPKGPRRLALKQEEPRISNGPSELFLLDHFQHHSSAHWSDWGPYGECFCNKRMRTRNCVYDDPAHSEGCEGKSYESIQCIGGKTCPRERKNLSINRRTSSTKSFNTHSTTRFHTISPFQQTTTEQRPHGDLFYPNPLPMSRRQFI